MQHRTDVTTDQMDAAFKALEAEEPHSGICSAASQSLMKGLDLGSSQIQALGHAQGDSLKCSSLRADALELGPPDLVQPSGVRLRTAVELPLAPGTRFLAVERSGHVAIVHPDLPLDIRLHHQ